MRFARIGVGSCGLAAGAGAVRDALDAALPTLGVEVVASPVGCVGLCHREPVLELSCPEFGTALYGDVTPERVPQLLAAHFIHGEPPEGALTFTPTTANTGQAVHRGPTGPDTRARARASSFRRAQSSGGHAV